MKNSRKNKNEKGQKDEKKDKRTKGRKQGRKWTIKRIKILKKERKKERMKSLDRCALSALKQIEGCLKSHKPLFLSLMNDVESVSTLSNHSRTSVLLSVQNKHLFIASVALSVDYITNRLRSCCLPLLFIPLVSISPCPPMLSQAVHP